MKRDETYGLTCGGPVRLSSAAFYPWMARTLQDERIVDRTAQTAGLQKKVVMWCEHVNARNEERAHL